MLTALGKHPRRLFLRSVSLRIITRFLGRQKLLQDIVDDFQDSAKWLGVIKGRPGTGKTRLVKEFAMRMQQARTGD